MNGERAKGKEHGARGLGHGTKSGEQKAKRGDVFVNNDK